MMMMRQLTVVLLAALLLGLVDCRPFHDEDSDPYQMLEQLERLYSQAGRPRLGRRGDKAPMDPDLMRNTLQLLQLHTFTDRYASRPRIGRRDATSLERYREEPDSFEGAIRLLQLHTIDRSLPYRPRYGKRAESFAGWNKNSAEAPDDAPLWLSLYSRR